MEAVHFFENGLNVDYVPQFFNKTQADSYFHVLKDLPYFIPTFKIRGRAVKPKRRVLAYGDPSTTYAFSGTRIDAEPWTSLMLELRDHVEKFAGCSFNYVLLNLYTDGTSYISPHKDDESGLDAAFPIVVLSFGAERTIEFKKPHFKATQIQLKHGSLYSMMKPTNDEFTHGIAPEPFVKGVRISLTFRHLVIEPYAKKQRLELPPKPVHSPKGLVCSTNELSSNEQSQVVNNLISDVHSSNELSSNEQSHVVNNPISDVHSSNEPLSPSELSDQVPFDIDQDDWLVRYYQKRDYTDPMIAQWHLNWSTYLQIVIEKNYKLRIHIRNFKENSKGHLYPSKQGIIMTPTCWRDFAGKIQSLKFHSNRESFIAFNQLACFVCDPEFCILQQMFPLNSPGYFLKPTVLKLTKDQMFRLVEFQSEISDSLIETLFCVALPKLISAHPPHCLNHLSEENGKQAFLDSVLSEILACTENLFLCRGCLNAESNENQESHECLTISTLDKFKFNKQNILLSVNIRDIISKLTCRCHYNSQFFMQFNMQLYEDYIMNGLSKM